MSSKRNIKSSVSLISPDIDIEPIDWFTKEYVQNALQDYYKINNLKITEIDVKPATKKGENYASILIRIKVEFIVNEKSSVGYYIVKTALQNNGFAAKKLQELDIYNRELEIYEKIVPKLNKLLQEIGDNDKLFPETIYVDYKHYAIIFEDLLVKSYKNADRLIGLDMIHTKMILRKIAKMHATCSVLNEREGHFLEKFDRGFFNRHNEEFKNYYCCFLDTCQKIVKEWDLDEFNVYAEKLSKLKPYIMEYGKKCFDPNENHFNTLIHGDFWLNNIMFCYKNQCDNKNCENKFCEPSDTLIIDLQYSCWTSPAIDLHYFLNNSLKEELRIHHLEELVQFYHTVLSDTLKKLNYKKKIPTLHEFWLQYIEKSFYGFITACLLYPITLNTETSDADFDALLEDNERSSNFRKIIFQNKRVQRNLQRLLPIYDRQGLLDIQN